MVRFKRSPHHLEMFGSTCGRNVGLSGGGRWEWEGDVLRVDLCGNRVIDSPASSLKGLRVCHAKYATWHKDCFKQRAIEEKVDTGQVFHPLPSI